MKIDNLTIVLITFGVLIIAGSISLNMELEDPNNQFDEQVTMRIIIMLLLFAPISAYGFYKKWI
jgi:hypothetical protein